MGGIEKFSFHTPTSCRRAFTKEHGAPNGRSNRATQEWHRGTTPPKGSNQVVRVLRIGITTDHLSTKLADPPPKNTLWIAPGPRGGATMIDIFFSLDDEVSLREALQSEAPSLGHELFAYWRLPNAEALCISSWHSSDAQKVFRVKAAPHDPRDLLILPDDPADTGRPVRLTLFSNPKDGDLMSVWEMGGYWQEPLTDARWRAICEAYEPAAEIDDPS